MAKNIKVSLVIPIHDMEDGAGFLWRCINSIVKQTFTDYEIVITKEGNASDNTNAGIMRARGDLIKFMHMDDYFAHEYALEEIVKAFKPNVKWVVNGTDNNPNPYWTPDIMAGNNKIGAPSAVTIRNDNPPLFDGKLVWLLDCDYYRKLYQRYGEPTILKGKLVNIGVHPGQATNKITDAVKRKEEAFGKRYV
jgi:glycosyltransferase involved in cell wall biosynthesis